ncbi:MAG: carboxypeptidase-like regulatory domain-containing protein [Candidatus Methylacidiphilales bacterium]
MIKHLKSILTLTILVIGLTLFAQTDTVQYGKLEVKVIDGMTKKPLEFAGVSVSINGKKAFKYTDIDGECIFDKIQYGKHLISISLSGYKKIDNFEIDIQKNITNFSKTLQSLNVSNVFIVHGKTINCFKPEKENVTLTSLSLLIVDYVTKKPIEYALVTLKGNEFKKSKYSNKYGQAIFDSLLTGTYNVTANCSGHAKTILEGMILKSDTIIKRTITLDSKIYFPLINHSSKPNLIKIDGPTQQNLNNKQIMRMPY